jgi:hypothetical protein
MKKLISLILSMLLLCGLTASLIACGGEHRMEGSVRNAITNEPMVGVTVTFDDKVKTKTNEEGLFAYEGIATGNHTVFYEFDGFKSLMETYNIQDDWFSEVSLLPSNMENDSTVMEDTENENDNTVDPIPPGSESVEKPELKFYTNLDNFRATLSNAPTTVSVENAEIIESVDGVVRISKHDNSMIDKSFEIIINGNTTYDKDPQTGDWFMHTEPVDPSFSQMTPATMIMDWFNIIREVTTTEEVKIIKLDNISIEDRSYQRFHISGLGRDITHSFKGEVYVYEGYVVGFDGIVSTGERDYQRVTQYVMIRDIGKVEAIQIPTNAKSIDFQDWTKPEPIPPEEMPSPPPEEIREQPLTDR